MHHVERLDRRPLMQDFGVEILGVDLARMTPEQGRGIVEAFQLHGALVLRGQSLSPAQFQDFVALFGEPEDHTMRQYTVPGHPKIFVLSNRLENGQPVGAHNDGIGWHTDYGYKAEPVMCTMLYAVRVPDEGSDTLLADLCAAYDALPEARKRQLETYHLQHSYEYLMTTREHGRATLSDALRAENPDVVHPLIRTHPANGRQALWVSGGTRGIVELPAEDGLALIDDLVAFVTQERFVYRHKWQVGDVLVWDNRCTLHTGTLFDDTRYIREMYRMWVKGDRPFFAPGPSLVDAA
jgi:taurine dioxygenase